MAWNFRHGRAVVKLCCGSSWESPFRKGGGGDSTTRIGVIDSDGKYVGSPSFSAAGLWFSGNELLARHLSGEIVIVHRTGQIQIVADVEAAGFPGFSEGLAAAAKGGKWGFIDRRGNWTIEPQFENATRYSEGLAAVSVGGRWGYVDRKGRFVVNPQFEKQVAAFTEGLAAVPVGGRWGFIDKTGRFVVPPQFVYTLWFSEGFASVQTDAGWGFIGLDGKMVVEPAFALAGNFSGGIASVKALDKWTYITKSGAFVGKPFEGRTLDEEKARRADLKAKAEQAEREAEAARVAEKTRARDERIRMIVGTWRWRNNETTTYQADGTHLTMSSSGSKTTNRWSFNIDGILTLEVAGAFGQRRVVTFRIVELTDTTFAVASTDGRIVDTGTRVR